MARRKANRTRKCILVPWCARLFLGGASGYSSTNDRVLPRVALVPLVLTASSLPKFDFFSLPFTRLPRCSLALQTSAATVGWHVLTDTETGAFRTVIESLYPGELNSLLPGSALPFTRAGGVGLPRVWNRGGWTGPIN
eukprot:1858229-Rhodomonas_salina.1